MAIATLPHTHALSTQVLDQTRVFKHRLRMSSAIDFDLSGVRVPRKKQWHTAQRERLLGNVTPAEGDHRQLHAKAASEADMPFPADQQRGCCGHPPGKVLEAVNMTISALCLLVSFVFCMIGVGVRVDDSRLPSRPRLAEVRLSREVLLFTNKQNLTIAMRHLQSEYGKYCKAAGYEMDLMVPTYDEDNEQRFKDLSSSTGYAMSINVSAGSVSLFAILMPVFAIALCFQTTRFLMYCSDINKEGLYKPWRGPEISRWLEYLFTSPLQIFVVSTAFGFGNRDTVVAHCVMQAALVLLGYDIEQYIKKIYKQHIEDPDTEVVEETVYAPRRPLRMHNILWRLGVEDIRGGLYLMLAWAMHFTIWFSIITRFWFQQSHREECDAKAANGIAVPRIPDTVSNIMWTQFIFFTLFGLLNTVQYIFASPRSVEHQKIAWYWYSIAYQVLSVMAKTALLIGFIAYVVMYRTWPLAPQSNVFYNITAGGQQCISVQYKTT